MSVQLGPNLIPNGGFNGSSGWLPTQVGSGLVQFADGQVRLVRPASGDGASVALNPGQNAVPGRQYQITIASQRITGQLRVTYGGIATQNTLSGVRQFIITASAATNFSIGAVDPYPSEHFVNYVTLREVGASMSKVVLTLRDYDGDKKQTSLELGPVTDGASYVTREGQAAAIRDAVNTVAGNIAGYDFLAQSTEPNNINTATPLFQTHVRWLVELFDSVSGDGPYIFDIPTADLGTAGLFLPASVEHDPAHAAWIALKAALNGIAINPRTGSTMTVGRIYLEE